MPDFFTGAPLGAEAASLCERILRPASGLICDARELSVCARTRHAVFAAVLVERLEGIPPTRIARVHLDTGALEMLTTGPGPNSDRLPKYSPDGHTIAFLSDRGEAGDFQLYLMDARTGASRAAPVIPGWIEYLHWSPDGQKILLGVAGDGADRSSIQGAARSARKGGSDSPAWAPVVHAGDEPHCWRQAWIFSMEDGALTRIHTPGTNIWEAVWCGNENLAAVVSSSPGEGAWYGARLAVISLTDGAVRELYTPRAQLGWPAASPWGRYIAVVEAVCSDRWMVAGDLLLFDALTGEHERIDTLGIDITYAEWLNNGRLALAGHRGLNTVLAQFDIGRREVTEIWSGGDRSIVGRYASTAPFNDGAEHAVITEGYLQTPEIGIVDSRGYRTVLTFGDSALVPPIHDVKSLDWEAADGLPIEGILLRPREASPHRTIMNVHGGPVSHWRPTWLGRSHLHLWLLLERGFAVFLPNPRGSSGRGQGFARAVIGDIGGADAIDCLSGLDRLVQQGLADPARLGVMGGSYGGYLTSWLITQDHRFRAAVSVAPMTNAVSERYLSNIPHFVSIFVGGGQEAITDKYFSRSPIFFAHNVRTPVLNVCGALDRCTPPEEAAQFHHALLHHGRRSVLVTYPTEGHGIRKLPATIDFAARVVSWFEEHIPRV